MKKGGIIKFLKMLNFKMKFKINSMIRKFIYNNPFVKKHIKLLIPIFILLIGLIGTIIWFYITILGEEETTTSITIIGGGDFRVTSNSKIRIDYIQNESDEITIDLRFENLGENKLASFIILYDGEMKIKEKEVFIVRDGIKKIWCKKYDNDLDGCKYEIDFQVIKPWFLQRYSCNLFEDKFGEVKLRLFIESYGDILNDIQIYFYGLDKFILESAYPEPEKEYLHGIEYTYKLDDESFINGIMLRGNNAFIVRKLQVIYFFVGVVVAILTSSLATLLVEIVKDI